MILKRGQIDINIPKNPIHTSAYLFIIFVSRINATSPAYLICNARQNLAGVAMNNKLFILFSVDIVDVIQFACFLGSLTGLHENSRFTWF